MIGVQCIEVRNNEKYLLSSLISRADLCQIGANKKIWKNFMTNRNFLFIFYDMFFMQLGVKISKNLLLKSSWVLKKTTELKMTEGKTV